MENGLLGKQERVEAGSWARNPGEIIVIWTRMRAAGLERGCDSRYINILELNFIGPADKLAVESKGKRSQGRLPCL